MTDTEKKVPVIEPVVEPTFAEFKAGMIAARIQMLAPHNAHGMTNYITKLYKIMNVPAALATKEQTAALLDATLGIFAYTHAMALKHRKESKP
jgi:hypothetical protein